MKDEIILNSIQIHVQDVKPVLENDSKFKKGSILVTAIGLTEKFVPIDIMEKYSWTFKGKEVRFDHAIPEQDVSKVIGHIHDVWIENSKLNFLLEVWGYREDLKKTQESILNNKMSISAGFKVRKNENQEVIDIYGREISITPFPKCTAEDGCGITASIIMNSEKTMPDENNALAMLKETSVKLSEERGEKIVELSEVISGLNDKIVTLNSNIKERDEMITELSKKNESLEDKIKVLSVTNEELKTLSLRSEYVEILGITDEKEKQKKIESLKKYSVEDLKEKIEDLSRVKEISIKKAKSSNIGNRPMFKDENNEQIEENALEKASADEITSSIYPDIKEKYIRNSRRNVPMPAGFTNDGNTTYVDTVTGEVIK